MVYFNKGIEYYNKKNYKKAIEMYCKSIELKENETASMYNAAVCFIKLKNYINAIPLIKAALERKKDSKYYFNLGYCYAMLKESKLALIYFNRAWALDNDDTECEKAINILLKQLTVDN